MTLTLQRLCAAALATLPRRWARAPLTRWGLRQPGFCLAHCTAARETPTLIGDATDAFLEVPLEDVLSSVPEYDERRKIIARDSLASVDAGLNEDEATAIANKLAVLYTGKTAATPPLYGS